MQILSGTPVRAHLALVMGGILQASQPADELSASSRIAHTSCSTNPTKHAKPRLERMINKKKYRQATKLYQWMT